MPIVSANSAHHGPLPFLVNIVFQMLMKEIISRAALQPMRSAARLIPVPAARKLIYFSRLATFDSRLSLAARTRAQCRGTRALFTESRFHANMAKRN